MAATIYWASWELETERKREKEKHLVCVCVCVVLGEIVRDPQFIIPAGSI
jgi:hypothetical protein